MPTVKFLGRVLPTDIVKVSASTPPLALSDSGFTAVISVVIEDSAVTVTCDLNKASPDDLARLYFWAFDQARVPVDMIAFSKASGLTVVLETFVDAHGNSTAIQATDARLSVLCTAFKEDDPASFHAVWEIVATTPEIFMALNDLIMALTMPHYGPRVAGQAIETIRRLLAPRGVEPKQQWPHMQRLLNVERDYLQYISDNATGPRHGDRTHVPAAITRELAIRAWTLMNRYLEFRKRGSVPLPQTEFPTLT